MLAMAPLRLWGIVGGHGATSPWLRAVAELDHCSGVLVRPDIILTSAHCVDHPLQQIVLMGAAMERRDARSGGLAPRRRERARR